MARKQVIELDDKNLELLRNLGTCFATQEDAAGFLNVSRQTLIASFKRHPELREAFESGHGKAKASLRMTLFKLSQKNAQAAIFLAKNHLGMTDKQEISGPNGDPIQIGRIEHVIIDTKDRNTESI